MPIILGKKAAFKRHNLITGVISRLLNVSFILSALITSSIMTAAQRLLTPPALTPPRGNVLFLTAHATGTQDYICQPSANEDSNTWVFFSPQATLFVPILDDIGQQILTHFLSPIPDANTSPESSCTLSSETGEISCPTWQSSLDSSAVWGGKIGSVNAGTDASCPHTGAIPCLLLNAVATRRGQAGAGILSKTTFIQRLNTEGGSAPVSSCKVGDQALVPYSADYFFYASENEDKNER